MAVVNADFPSNSKKTKVQGPVVKGPVIEVEKKAGNKVADAFKSAGSYILKDVLIPALKDTAVSMVTGAVQMVCYGETRNVTPKGSWSYGSSSSYYHGAYGAQQPIKRTLSSAAHGIGDIQLTEEDADTVLDLISRSISTYGRCPVAAVKQWVGISSDCMDENYGWTTMEGFAKSRYTATDVLLHFPQAINI